MRGARKPKNTGMGIGACSDSTGAGDGRTPRHNREAPAVPYRERAGNILEHSRCFVGRSIWSHRRRARLWSRAGRAGIAQPGKGKIQGRSSEHLPVPKGAPEGWERLGTKTRNGRKRGNGFKLEKGRLRWEIGKKFLQGNAGASQHVPSRPRQQEHPEMLQNMEYPT